MAKFEVYFFGLICHVGETLNRKSHAVIVDAVASQHVPLIVINGTPHRLSKGNNISFSLPSGDVTTQQDFNSYLPSLRDLIIGIDDLHDEIKSKTNHPDVIGYVSYPQGELQVANRFPKSAEYTLGPVLRPDECVARLTYVQITTFEPEVEVRFGNTTEIVQPNSWILIANSSPAGSVGHFFEYLKLTKGSDIARAAEGAKNCDFSAGQYIDDVKNYLHITGAKSFDAASIARDEARAQRVQAGNSVSAQANSKSVSLNTSEDSQDVPPARVSSTAATDIECSNSRWP